MNSKQRDHSGSMTYRRRESYILLLLCVSWLNFVDYRYAFVTWLSVDRCMSQIHVTSVGLFLCIRNKFANILPTYCLHRSLEACEVGFGVADRTRLSAFSNLYLRGTARPSVLLQRCCCLAAVMDHLHGVSRELARSDIIWWCKKWWLDGMRW
jgi:hypothetical protein